MSEDQAPVKRKVVWVSPEERAEMVRMYESGESVRHIAKAFNRSYGGVYHNLMMSGVKMRATGKRSPENMARIKAAQTK